MGKPFANAPGLSGEIQDTYLLGMQSGTDLDDTGLVQMKKISAKQLREFCEQNFGSIWTYRGEFSSALPGNPATGDVFYASADFTVDEEAYAAGTFYAYSNEGEWSAINNAITAYVDIASQYARGKKTDGTDVVEGEAGYHDNAKYYAEVALGAIVDPTVLFDGTRATYLKVMRNWFIAKGALTATSAELTALCDEWYTITRTGWNGYTTFYQPSASASSSGTKGGDNAGLVCTPSTDTVKNTDSYEGLPLFAIIDCNWIVDSTTLEPVITAIDGITSNFTRTDPDVFVGVLQMAPYHYHDELSTTYVHGVSDTYQAGHDHCEPVPEAVRPETSDRPNEMRPWVVHAKYGAYVSDSKFRCYSGVTPTAQTVSHNTSQTYARNNGSQYSGSCNCDRDWLILMTYIKYASLTLDGILQGCCNYYRSSASYVVAYAESDTTRLLVTASVAANLVDGSTIRFGSGTGYGSGTSYDVSGFDGAKILSRETVTIDGTEYVALNTDASTSFTTTTSTYITSWHWRTGSCDTVLGNDGSPVSCTNGVYPAKIQGIEYMYGYWEVLSDTIFNLTQDADDTSVYYYEPYHVRRSANQTTSISTNYEASGLILQQPSSSAWQYPKKMQFNGKNFFYDQLGGSSSTYLRDGFYMLGATTGLREVRLFGCLVDGSGYAGLSAGTGDYVLSTAYWHVGGRLSPNGNRGEWAA